MAVRELPIHGGRTTTFAGRSCVTFDEPTPVLVPIEGSAALDGTVEIEVCVDGERSFPGVAWRIQGQTYESFFVRPHQSGNPDSVQYTPVFNGVSGWQLYHGRGYWASIEIPTGEWFTLRVGFAGARAEAYVGDMSTPALVFARVRAPIVEGGMGILPGGEGTYFARFAFDPTAPTLVGAPPPREEREPGVVPGWWISNLLPEGHPPSNAKNWTYIEAEADGLTDIARLHPLGTTLNTAFARATVSASSAGTRAFQVGFSDRAIVFLNGRPLFRGDDSYRSRDYRFLGSIGYWDTLYLPLLEGQNELLVALSETFGGWGLKGRFPDPGGLWFPR